MYFITSVLLQLDFLQNHIPYQNIAGLLVCDSHLLHSGNTTLFCILLFRHRCNGFVKCFSDNAMACCYAFPQLSSFLNKLTVSFLFLYPRFRDIVSESLSKYPLQLEECLFEYAEWMEVRSDVPFICRKHICSWRKWSGAKLRS